MVSACNAWAVGYYVSGTVVRTLIVHWNGVKWRPVQSPNPSGPSSFNQLKAVAATSSRSAWAVGDYNNGSGSRTLIVRWNGTKWRQVTSPNPGLGAHTNVLNAVRAASSLFRSI